MTAPSFIRDALVERLVGALPALNEADASLALALYRELAQGAPVARRRLAQRVGLAVDDVDSTLERWPGVFSDERGDIVGFWGLALPPMRDELYVDGRRLHAWCAWDTLFLPQLLARPASVRSTCPVTGEPIALRVDDDGVHDLAPASAAMSFRRPEDELDESVVTTFCHYVNFFASEDAAATWTQERPGTFPMSIDDGYAIARATNVARFGAVLASR